MVNTNSNQTCQAMKATGTCIHRACQVIEMRKERTDPEALKIIDAFDPILQRAARQKSAV